MEGLGVLEAVMEELVALEVDTVVESEEDTVVESEEEVD